MDDCGNDCKGNNGDSEMELHLKRLLETQQETDVSLHGILQRGRQFSSSTTQTSSTNEIKGQVSLAELKKIENRHEERDSLRRLGLTDDEINFYSNEKSEMKNYSSAEPSTIEAKLNRIRKKIDEAKICDVDAKDGDYIVGDVTKKKIRSDDDDGRHPDHPMNHLDDIATQLFGDKRKKSNDVVEPDPSVHNVVVPLCKDEIVANRLTLEQIKRIPRFQDYRSGNPSKTLFVKNLQPKTQLSELMALFGDFQPGDQKDYVPIKYRLLNGRMKGQAFVTFPNTESASNALQTVNGYKMNDRPVVVQYGKT